MVPLLMRTLPAVAGERTCRFPVPFPYTNAPEVTVERPVPPWVTGKTPVTSPDAKLTALDVNKPLEFAWTMPVERLDKVVLPVTFRVPLVMTLPLTVAEVNGLRSMLPVLPPPKVRVWEAVVWIEPVLSKVKEPVCPETVAVVVVVLTPSTANLAEAVETPPTNKSAVLLMVFNAPFWRVQ